MYLAITFELVLAETEIENNLNLYDYSNISKWFYITGNPGQQKWEMKLCSFPNHSGDRTHNLTIVMWMC